MAPRVIVKSCRSHAAIWPRVNTTFRAHLAFIYYGEVMQPERWHLKDYVLSVNASDNYDNLATKMILALLFYHEHYGGPVFHVDDDASLSGPFTPNLKGIDYGGPRIQGRHRLGANRSSHFDRVPLDSYWYQRLGPPHNAVGHAFAHGGCGIFLSARAIDIVLARYNLSNLERVFFEEIYDDVMLSDILAAHGIGVKFVRGSNLVGDKPEHSGHHGR
jgi:hypothetical protein